MADVARGSLQHGSTFNGAQALVDASHLLRGEVEVVHAQFARPGQDAVVHVGDVANALRIVPAIA